MALVAVKDAAPVQVGQRLQELHEQRDLGPYALRAPALQDALRAGQELHGKERALLGVEAEVEHLDDVRVVQRGQHLELVDQGQAQPQARPQGRSIDRGRRIAGRLARVDALERHLAPA
jgi:hypothetical protein